MVARDGTKVWTQAIQGASEALWIDDKTLAILGAGGLVRFRRRYRQAPRRAMRLAAGGSVSA